eukprot:TRINITY_DN1322_c0_g1_i4.p1 TRINITY_DN1322_c0_g1~~TRINITY_DN1322_c0_g1_i4.p1  ORF type:complete len:217 (+),score=27.46 TRINITY_DN1322_c0_g1_i4:66-716(+)
MSQLMAPPESSWVPPPRSKWAVAPASPRCPACRTPIYPAEVVIAAHHTPFHKWCIKCRRCKKPLTPATLNEHMKKLYCHNCYKHVFMVKDYQQYSSEEFHGLEAEEDKAELARAERKEAERKKREKFCPNCKEQVWPIDSIQVLEDYYHQACVKCYECELGPDEDTPMTIGPKDRFRHLSKENQAVYCESCFEKIPKIVTLSITEALTLVQDPCET